MWFSSNVDDTKIRIVLKNKFMYEANKTNQALKINKLMSMEVP